MAKLKARIMDEQNVERALKRMAHEITEKNRGVDNLVLIGIKRRGEPLAKRLAENLKMIEGTEVPVGTIDIRFYRDDLTKEFPSPTLQTSELGFDVAGKKIVLVDDVLFSGRTVRAAIEAVFSMGRPDQIQLAILIDRGHRELPFRADYVGKNIPTSYSEHIAVLMPPYDLETAVDLYETKE